MIRCEDTHVFLTTNFLGDEHHEEESGHPEEIGRNVIQHQTEDRNDSWNADCLEG